MISITCVIIIIIMIINVIIVVVNIIIVIIISIIIIIIIPRRSLTSCAACATSPTSARRRAAGARQTRFVAMFSFVYSFYFFLSLFCLFRLFWLRFSFVSCLKQLSFYVPRRASGARQTYFVLLFLCISDLTCFVLQLLMYSYLFCLFWFRFFLFKVILFCAAPGG